MELRTYKELAEAFTCFDESYAANGTNWKRVLKQSNTDVWAKSIDSKQVVCASGNAKKREKETREGGRKEDPISVNLITRYRYHPLIPLFLY